jgi:hypothetical protein
MQQLLRKPHLDYRLPFLLLDLSFLLLDLSFFFFRPLHPSLLLPYCFLPSQLLFLSVLPLTVSYQPSTPTPAATIPQSISHEPAPPEQPEENFRHSLRTLFLLSLHTLAYD